MSHPGNWRRHPRKMALEMERARRSGRPTAVEMMRPFDTEQLGWRATAQCDLCPASWPYRAPADLRKCHWYYVVTQTACPKHRTRPADSISFYSGDRCYMGTVQRLS